MYLVPIRACWSRGKNWKDSIMDSGITDGERLSSRRQVIKEVITSLLTCPSHRQIKTGRRKRIRRFVVAFSIAFLFSSLIDQSYLSSSFSFVHPVLLFPSSCQSRKRGRQKNLSPSIIFSSSSFSSVVSSSSFLSFLLLVLVSDPNEEKKYHVILLRHSSSS